MSHACSRLRTPITKVSSEQRDNAEARFSAGLPIGPPWRLRIRASLILASAPEDKRTLVPCHWQGAELAKAFTKALSPSLSEPVPHLCRFVHSLSLSTLVRFPPPSNLVDSTTTKAGCRRYTKAFAQFGSQYLPVFSLLPKISQAENQQATYLIPHPLSCAPPHMPRLIE